MKKTTVELLKWQCQRQRRQARKRYQRGSQRSASGRRAAAKADYYRARNRLPETKWEFGAKWATFFPPPRMSFVDAYGPTLAFILDVRRLFSEKRRFMCPDGMRRPVHAAFSTIETIDPAAGLVLAAEIDRWSRNTGYKALSFDEGWRASVRSYFAEAGLFELLRIDPKVVTIAPDGEPERRTLKFLTATNVVADDARRLRTQLEALCGQAIGPRATVYAAIAEAISNVTHAYPSWFTTWPRQRAARWWTSGSWTPSSKIVGVQLYDQGAGIPKTLPKRPYWGSVIPLVRMLDPESSDAGLIQAALEYGRTSTGVDGRGKGLSEMAEWIDKQGRGFLRITSGSGQVTYRPDRRVSRVTLAAPFCGTLVEWEFELDG